MSPREVPLVTTCWRDIPSICIPGCCPLPVAACHELPHPPRPSSCITFQVQGMDTAGKEYRRAGDHTYSKEACIFLLDSVGQVRLWERALADFPELQVRLPSVESEFPSLMPFESPSLVWTGLLAVNPESDTSGPRSVHVTNRTCSPVASEGVERPREATAVLKLGPEAG